MSVTGRGAQLVAVLCLLLSASGCTSVPAAPARADSPAAQVPRFTVGEDTFAFRNEIRSKNPDVPDLYAHYCFVMARAVRQFHIAARFDPARPPEEARTTREKLGRVLAVDPWRLPLPVDDRVVIPGYRNLHELSRTQELLVKEALGGRLWTWIHWTNWRVTLPVTGGHQDAVAQRIAAEIAAGRLVQLLVTNWPIPELNHTVVAFAYRERERAVDFGIYDPNEPEGAGIMTFESDAQRFWATRMFQTRPGKIRAFRMYHTPLL